VTPDAPAPTTSPAEVANQPKGDPSTRPPRPERGDEVELRIDSLAFGGAGVARYGDGHGWVVFVRDALPGDTVRAVITKRKRHYGEARMVEIVTPSPDRVAPLADHPGAPWQVIPYEQQLEIKSRQVDEALRRLGHLDGFELLPIVPAVEQWRYRNKLEFSFGTDGEGQLICGFHAPGSWEDIVHVEDCLLQSERGNEARRAVLEWARSEGYTAYDRRSQLGALRNLVIREGRRTGEIQVRLVVSDGVEVDAGTLHAAVAADSLLVTSIETVGETTAGGSTELVAGNAKIGEELGGLQFQLSAQAFFQTNTEMAEKLYAVAAEVAGLQGWERVYDLFCGIGTIGLSLASKSGEVWGLEIVETAIGDAINNAKANNISNTNFFAGDVRLALRELVEKAGRPDVIVVDPPRAGLSQKVVRRVLEASPKRIVYVSCNPTTLAPNAAQMVEAGYILKTVRPVDMFPQTPHIECVALLERGPEANQIAAGD
jgi:23S rRNA (uracil1939-C5)-methyltransferase